MNENIMKHTTTGMEVASLVLGLIAIITPLFWYMVLPTSILAIVFGVKSNHKKNSRLGRSGMVLGIVALAIFAFIYISLIIIISLSNL